MSALGHKQTSRALVIYVRYWGESGLSGAPLRMSAYSQERTLGPSLNRIFLSVLGPDHLGTSLHPLCLIGAPGLSEQCSIVFQALGHVRVLGPKGLLPDRQRPLVERLGLRVVALGNTATFSP